MTRTKKAARAHRLPNPTNKLTRKAGITKSKSKSKPPLKPQPATKSPKPHTQAQHTEPTIPFAPSDHILLIGEGDLSFARSVVEGHGCKNVVATVFEKLDELKEKYPNAEENAWKIEDLGGSVKYGIDATKIGPVWREMKAKVDRVVFNFPHVGGKSTDVNRQVRYNQELLVAFFKQALSVLAPSTSQLRESTSSKKRDGDGDGKTSSIVVTLFEGEPYTLWNIRDLARHAGFAVERSFRFQAAAYEGYKHVRTLGVVKGKDGKEGGGWKGEERNARSYVFVRKGEESAVLQQGKKKKKGEGSSDDETESKATMDGEKDVDDWTPGGIDESAVHPSRRSIVPGS